MPPLGPLLVTAGLLFACPLPSSAQGTDATVLHLQIRSNNALQIGRVSKVDWVIENLSGHPLIVLEIQPEQPCEERIDFVRTLYGDITYVEKFDQFLYDAIPQKSGLIPVYEGYIPAEGTLVYSSFYRPFARRESFTVSYAIPGAEKLYFRKQADAMSSRFSIDGKDTAQVIVPRILDAKKAVTKVQIDYPEIAGTESSLCYCQTLNGYQQYPPYSMCKEWDSGQTVKFRVGENQKGTGPDQHPAGWKFAGNFDVYYGDNVYTHGEFVSISPEQAPQFMKLVEGKYSFKKIEYFLTDHYYDLEPAE